MDIWVELSADMEDMPETLERTELRREEEGEREDEGGKGREGEREGDFCSI